MADNKIVITASLDFTASTTNIRNDLTKIADKLNADKAFKIVVNADLSKTQTRIQSQLNTISKNLKLDVGNINVGNVNTQNIVGGLKSVQNQVEQTVNVISNNSQKLDVFKESLRNMGMNSTRVDSIANAMRNLDVQITSINQSLDTTAKKSILSVEITGIDKLGQAVTLTRQYNTDTGDLIKNHKALATASQKSASQIENMVAEQTTKARERLETATAKSSDKSTRQRTSNIQAYQKEIDNTIDSLNRLNNNTAFRNNSANANVQIQRQNIQNLITQYEMLKTQLQGKISPEGLKQIESILATLKSQFDVVQNECTELKISLNSNSALNKFGQDVDILKNRIIALKNANSKSVKDFGQDYNKLLASVDVLQTSFANGEIDVQGLNTANRQFRILEGNIRNANKVGHTLFKTLGEQAKKFSQWMSLTFVISSFARSLRNMVTEVIELDSAMTSLKKVTDETDASYDKFLDNATKRAKELGTTITDLVESTSEFAKLGYSMDDAAILGEVASVYSNVGELDIADATASLVSSMAAFGIEAENAMGIVDRFNAVGNQFSISSAGIGDALQRSASSLKAAGNSIDESIAMITAANTVVQDPDVIGTSLKTLSLRLTSTSAELEALGEDTEFACETLSDYRNIVMGLTNNKVDILGDDGQYKNTYNILKDISKVWHDMDSMSQSSLMKTLFGVRQANVGVSLIEQFGTAEKVLEASLNSSGSAMEEHSRWLESASAKTQQFKASFESLSQTVINSDFLKGLIDGGTTFLNILEKLIDTAGVLPTLLGAIGGGLAIKNVGNLKSWITDLRQATLAVESFKNISETYEGVGLDAIIDETTIAKYATSIEGLTKEQAELALSTTKLMSDEKDLILIKAGLIAETKSLTSQDVMATLQQKLKNKEDSKELLLKSGLVTATELEENAIIDVTKEKIKAVLASKTLSNSEKQLLLSTLSTTGANYSNAISFKVLTKAIWENITAMAKWLVTNPLGWVAIGGTALFSLSKIIDTITESTEEATEAAKEAKQEYEDSISQIETLNSKIEENNRLIEESGDAAVYDGYRKRLEAENIELERQIELEKIRAQEAKTEADKKAKKVLYSEEYKYNKHDVVHATGAGYITKWSEGDILDATDWYLDQAESTGKVDDKLKEYINTIQEQRDNLDTSNAQSKELYDQLGLLIDRYIALYEVKTKTETGVADNSIQDTASKLAEFNEQFSKQFEEKSKPTLENISKIEEAMQAISDGENVDFDTMWEINELDTEGIISSIDEVNGAYKMSIDELIALKNSLANGETEYWEAQKQDAQNAIQEIKKLKAVAEARLNAKKLEIGFIDSASEAELLAEELEEIASYNSQIAEYENIIKDCTLGITEFNRHLGDTIDYTKTIESLTEQADELLEAQENAIDDIIDSLNAEKDILESQKDALDSQLEVLEEQQEAIETIIDNYEQVADIASDAIQDEIDTLEENKQSIEDYYDEMIKKLQDANDERQEAIDLAEKQAALENAKKNKVRTFDESRGWVELCPYIR